MSEGLFLVFQLLVLLYSVVIHEVSHGLMANSLGDPTAKSLGRLTLNPIKHLDMFGSFILPLFLFIINTPFIFGYAKPVPYNPANFVDRKYGPAKVALAGPASNIILALIFGGILRFMPDIFSSPLIPQLFASIVAINLVLAIFNLIPVPPLDGHWILFTFLPARFSNLKIFMYRYSLILIFFIIIFIIPIVFSIIPVIFKAITGLSF